jgi:hypothetical protein
MSASAAAAKSLPPLKEAVNKNKVASAVAGAGLFIYAVWEIRMRAAAKAGKVPITLTDVIFRQETVTPTWLPLLSCNS